MGRFTRLLPSEGGTTGRSECKARRGCAMQPIPLEHRPCVIPSCSAVSRAFVNQSSLILTLVLEKRVDSLHRTGS